jgi:small subunit ribosomal protein S5
VVLECAGIHDVLSKSLGSSNQINIVHATVEALRMLEQPETVAARRGLRSSSRSGGPPPGGPQEPP